MADGTNFMVDLAALEDAIGTVSGERETINGGVASLRATFSKVETHWKSPAGSSFVGLVTNFNAATDTLTALLDEAIDKMRAAHDNYAATENTNTGNYQAKVVGSGDTGSTSQQGPDTQSLGEPQARQQAPMASEAPKIATNVGSPAS